MTARNDFNPHEWQQIVDSVTITGFAVAYADMNYLGLIKEMSACYKEAMAAKDDPGANELIRAVGAAIKTSAIISEQVKHRFGIGRIGASETTAAEMKAKAVEALREVSSLLDGKAPREAAAFKPGCSALGRGLRRPQRRAGSSGLAACG